MKLAACVLPLLSRARLARAATERVAAAERDSGRLRARAQSRTAGPADAAEIGWEHRALQADTCAVEGTKCGSEDIEVRILTDNHPENTAWLVRDSHGAERFFWSGIEKEAYTEYTIRLSLDPDEYTFEIYDWLGDGLCCEQGEGYYAIWSMLTGNELVVGGEFDDFVTEAFTVSQDRVECCESDGPCQVSTDSQVGWCGCIPEGEICEQEGALCCGGSGFCNWGHDGTGASSTCEGGPQGGSWCNANEGQCEAGCGGRWCTGSSGFSCNPIGDGQISICESVEEPPAPSPLIPTPPPGGAGGAGGGLRCMYTGDDIQANCPSGQFCELPTGECLRNTAFWRGTCSPIRDVCPSDRSEVCGCDSNTYSSACAAHGAPQNVADSNGACAVPAPTPPPPTPPAPTPPMTILNEEFCQVYYILDDGKCEALRKSIRSEIRAGVPTLELGDPSEKPVMLFFHGWPDTYAMWANQFAHFCGPDGEYSCVAPSMQDYNPDVPPADEANLFWPLQADIFHEVVEELGLKDMTLVYHDFGAIVGSMYVSKYPENVKRAVSLDIGNSPGTPREISDDLIPNLLPFQQGAIAAYRTKNDTLMQETIEGIAASPLGVGPPCTTCKITPDSETPIGYRVGWMHEQFVNPTYYKYIDTPREDWEFNLSPTWPDSVPLLFLWGFQGFHRPSLLTWLDARGDGSGHKRISPGDHWFMVRNLNEVQDTVSATNEAMEEFFAGTFQSEPAPTPPAPTPPGPSPPAIRPSGAWQASAAPVWLGALVASALVAI